jgi:uncharacterized protein YbcI
MTSIDPPLRHDPGSVASEISREVVRLHARLFGRGPTRAKTYLEDEYVLCILEDVFTPAEHTLIGAGREDQVHATRSAFQTAVEGDFVTIVEIATGRKVRCFISEVHVGAGIAAELFLLEPQGVAKEAVPSTESEPSDA